MTPARLDSSTDRQKNARAPRIDSRSSWVGREMRIALKLEECRPKTGFYSKFAVEQSTILGRVGGHCLKLRPVTMGGKGGFRGGAEIPSHPLTDSGGCVASADIYIYYKGGFRG